MTRLLPFAEWSKLQGTEIPSSVWALHDRASLQFVVVENEAGEIVATWATLVCRHVECFWVRPDHRGTGGVLRRLFVGMRELLIALRATTVITLAETNETRVLLEDAGATALPGTLYLLPVDFGPWATKGQD
jgi:hypothetical protein